MEIKIIVTGVTCGLIRRMSMFIPVWAFHILATVLLVIGIMWAMRGNDAYDFFPFFAVPSMLLVYAIYWIIVLVIKVYHK